MGLAERRAAARARISIHGPDLTRPLKGARVVVLNTETTERDPKQARIVEVSAAVITELGRTDPVVVYHQRVNPGVPIPSGATDVHGITDQDVADCPTWEHVWPELCRRLGDASFLPCAFNAPYDQVVLEHETRRHGGTVPRWLMWGHWADPLVLAKLVDAFERGKKLRDVAQRRGIQHAEHGAAADAVVTGMLLRGLLIALAQGVHDRGRLRVKMPAGQTLAEFLTWQRHHALAQEVELAEYFAKSGRKTPFDWSWHALEQVPVPDSARREKVWGCHVEGCPRVATHAPAGRPPTACWEHAGDWPEAVLDRLGAERARCGRILTGGRTGGGTEEEAARAWLAGREVSRG